MRCCTSLVALLLAELATAQASVFQVSPSGPLNDVQAAIDVALDGDVIEVAPGVYPAFAVTGKELSILGIDPVSNAAATFGVTGAPNTPAIRIAQVPIGKQMTLSGARIQHIDPTAPAIVIEDNPYGGVRLLDVVVTTLTALGTVPYDGVVEIRDTWCAWLVRTRVGDHRVFANGAAGTTGLAGVHCEASQLYIDQCDLRGLRSADMNIAAGDGLHTVGPTVACMVDSLLMGGMSQAGAAPNTLGGHPVHDSDGNAGILSVCGCTLTPAVSTVSLFAVAGAVSFLAACDGTTLARTSLSPFSPTLPIGSATTVVVSAEVGNRAFVLGISDAFTFVQIPGLFTGPMLFGGNLAILAGGVLGTTVQQVPLSLPLAPAGIGLQMVLQSVVLAPGTAPWNLSMSTGAGFTVR